MDPLDDTPDPELDRALRAARPTPNAAWAAELRRELLPDRPTRRRRVPLGGLVAATGGLAAVVAIAGLAGGGPLAADGGDDARAKPGCEVVYVTQARSVGEIVRQPDGTVTVETRTKPVSRAVQRCR